jgi:hypothetical protein
VFHDVAYKARHREDILAGLDEFLDHVTVLPPAEWDPTIRIEPPKNIPSQDGRKKSLSTGVLDPKGLPGEVTGDMTCTKSDGKDDMDLTLQRTGRYAA